MYELKLKELLVFSFEAKYSFLQPKTHHFRNQNIEVWWHETICALKPTQGTDVLTRALLVTRYMNKQIK